MLNTYQRLEVIRKTANRLSRTPVATAASNPDWLKQSQKCTMWREIWLEAAYVQRRIERGEI